MHCNCCCLRHRFSFFYHEVTLLHLCLNSYSSQVFSVYCTQLLAFSCSKNNTIELVSFNIIKKKKKSNPISLCSHNWTQDMIKLHTHLPLPPQAKVGVQYIPQWLYFICTAPVPDMPVSLHMWHLSWISGWMLLQNDGHRKDRRSLAAPVGWDMICRKHNLVSKSTYTQNTSLEQELSDW